MQMSSLLRTMMPPRGEGRKFDCQVIKRNSKSFQMIDCEEAERWEFLGSVNEPSEASFSPDICSATTIAIGAELATNIELWRTSWVWYQIDVSAGHQT